MVIVNRFRFLPILVLFLSVGGLAHAADCWYVPKESGQIRNGLSPQGECGEFIGEDGFHIRPDHLGKMVFKDGPAELFAGGKVFYVSRSGKAVRVYLFDNGADYFSEGLARTVSGNKFGFLDKDLNIVIKPAYDFAFPFENGIAVVCNGCSLTPEGEHRDVTGGRWGTINKSGKIVVPLENTKKELEKRLDH